MSTFNDLIYLVYLTCDLVTFGEVYKNEYNKILTGVYQFPQL